MLIKDIGEFALIERFKRKIKTDSSVIKGSGDDCAVLKLDKQNHQLFTCDMLVEGVDFTLKDNSYLVGRKAIAVSLSDIASCSGKPRHCVISLGLPKNTSLSFVDKLFQGMLDIAKKYKVNIVGGDLSRSSKVVLDVSMLGEVEKKYLTLRSGARVGDIIFITGELGGSISGKHLQFTPRIKEARFLSRNFKVKAMTDISDGLTSDLGHILEQSNAGAVIYEALIPLSGKARNLSDALNNGEDFELLFTLSRPQALKLLKRKLSIFRPIGEIRERKYGFQLIDKRSRPVNIKPKGFKHF
ncbi:MAG: thiamine-phosphate kinase [Candidatus Omnitrophota bacterium]|nr:thiamine-phosphate kinase [Candidatus Omnitrophota bacterium]